MPRYLTKSRYRMACECPTKLFYTGKKDTYQDNSLDDPFLNALRDGGFQVGELARQYYEPGTSIDTLDEVEALQRTDEELRKNEVTIFEAAFLYQNLFIRADIVQKSGNSIRLIEVKSGSFDEVKDASFVSSRGKTKGKIKSKWEPTFQDIAFQTHVVRQAKPGLEVTPFLLLVDKTLLAPVEGMNSYFFLKKCEGSKYPKVVVTKQIPAVVREREHWILREIPVEKEVSLIHGDTYDDKSFAERIHGWAEAYDQDRRIDPVLTKDCRDCQFRAMADERKAGKRSGFHECWNKITGLTESDLDQPLVPHV